MTVGSIKEWNKVRTFNGIYSENTSSARRGIKIFWFLHGLVMEAFPQGGSSFRRESFGAAVADGQRFVCKAFSFPFLYIREIIALSSIF